MIKFIELYFLKKIYSCKEAKQLYNLYLFKELHIKSIKI